MEIGKERYLNRNAVYRIYGKKVRDVLLAFHSVTECDVASRP